MPADNTEAEEPLVGASVPPPPDSVGTMDEGITVGAGVSPPVGMGVTVGLPVGDMVGDMVGCLDIVGADVVGAPEGINEGMSEGIPDGDPEGESDGVIVGMGGVSVQLSNSPVDKNSKTLPEGTEKSSSHKSKEEPASTLLQSKAGRDKPALGPDVQFLSSQESHIASLTVTAQLMQTDSSVSSSVAQSAKATVTVSSNPWL